MSTKHLLLFLLLSTMTQQLSAGSFIGGDVRYRHLNARQYEVTVAVYRDCRGIGLNSPPRAVVYNDSFEILLSLTRVKIEEIKGPACAGGCITNTPSNQGDEKHTFLDTVNFASGAYTLFGTQARPLVYFAFEQCCRNSAITTYAPGNMFVDAMLNLYYANQNSAKIGFNDFLFPAETYLSCQQTHNTSYRTLPYQSNDSQVYEMVRAKEDKNAEAIYDPYKPLTYFCGNPNVYTCQSNTSLNPVRGFTFNSSNGNLMTTPANCAEVGTMVCRVSIYRRSGNSSVLVGYMKRDYIFVVTPTPGERVPYILKNKDYTIKAREQFCVDIPVKDDKDALQAQADTVLVTVIKAPVFGQLSLLDSNTREKTLHYCWTPTDADYLSNKRDEFIINGNQKKCLMMKKRGLSTTIQFQVIAPDSLCTITVKTYEDKNKNGQKDGKETYSQALFFTQQKSIYTPYYTDSTGSLVIRPFYGQFALGIQEQLEIIGAKVPIGLNARFDSSYVVELGYVKRPGIKGRVYEDKNNNCVFDGNDVPLAQQKVVADSQNRIAFTDNKGYYFIQTNSGNLTLKLAASSAYQTTCNSSYQVTMPSDSVLLNKDFAVNRRSSFKDLSVEIVTKPNLTQNQMLSQDIKITNNGFTTQRYVTVKLVSNRRLPEFKSTLTTYKSADTFLWVLDSIRPLSSRSITFEVRMNKDTFKNGESICYAAWLRSDSVDANNRFSICESIIDSVYVPQLKQSKNPVAVSDYDNTLCYQLSYADKSANHNFLIFKDTLDAGKFDLNSFAILTATPGLKVNLLDNVLLADYSGNIVAGTEIFVRYTIALKTPFVNSFVVRNTAYVKVDNDNTYQSQTVVNTTRSALVIEPLTDTVYCAGEWLAVPVRTRFAPDKFYQCRILLSDSSSGFTVPVILKDTVINKVYTILPVRLPLSTPKGQAYQLKVVLTNVSLSSFESDFKQTLQVNALPVAALSSNLLNGYICSEDTLKTMASGADSMVFFYNTYQVNIISTQKAFNFVPNANGRLQVLAKDINGCTDSSEVLLFKLHQLPKIQLKAAPELCFGDSLNITVSGAQQYDWYLNNNLVKSGTDTIINSGALTLKTTFKVRGTDANLCSNTDSVKVLVNALPLKPQLYAEKARFYSSYPLRNQWYLNQVKIDSAINQYFYPPVYGLYQVEYTDLKGCKSKSESYEYKYVSITEVPSILGLVTYPNPFDEQLQINNGNTETLRCEVLSSDGKQIVAGLSIAPGQTSIDTHDWSSGIYVLVIYHHGIRQVVRLSKM
jgi:hypothetical protein